jgi:hypothetical protein
MAKASALDYRPSACSLQTVAGRVEDVMLAPATARKAPAFESDFGERPARRHTAAPMAPRSPTEKPFPPDPPEALPFGLSWRVVYALVLGALGVQIAIYAVLTRVFT